MSEKNRRDCEGCGGIADVQVRVTNGSLFLCKQCLDDINRKNPELAALRRSHAAKIAQARGLAARWDKQHPGMVFSSELRAVLEQDKPQAEPPAASGLTALAAKWREAAADVHCGTLAERKVLRRCADELEVTLRGVK